jgi:hypothetical protein
MQKLKHGANSVKENAMNLQDNIMEEQSYSHFHLPYNGWTMGEMLLLKEIRGRQEHLVEMATLLGEEHEIVIELTKDLYNTAVELNNSAKN